MTKRNIFISSGIAALLLLGPVAVFAQGGPGGGPGGGRPRGGRPGGGGPGGGGPGGGGPGGGGPGGGNFPGLPANITSTGPIAQVQSNANGATVTFNYNPRATQAGTAGESDFLVQVPEAINIPPNI